VAATAPAHEAPLVAGAVFLRTPDRLVRLYVWELPVRVAHWLIVFTIIVLAITGLYLDRPFLVGPRQDGFLLATMRFVHEIAGFVFTAALLARVVWFFTGNGYASWRAFVPLTRAQWLGIRAMLGYYLFLRWRPPPAIGHNPLAALAYLGVYLLILVQVLTGFALYAWLLDTRMLWTLFGWLVVWWTIQPLRLVHFFLTFVFFAFAIHHVYSATLVSAEEKNGTMDSIFSGFKYVPARSLHADEATLDQAGAPVDVPRHVEQRTGA
jgi:Ni/Fe-hydrogenase 1 B-type cytochrome subunit